MRAPIGSKASWGRVGDGRQTEGRGENGFRGLCRLYRRGAVVEEGRL